VSLFLLLSAFCFLQPYFPIFKLTGFNGFDGDWQK
jgi:hypothetical protein